ncbi:MAG: hypothetical protein HY207_00310 [Nitrospirae bacterium]|nr:hypothetical protein [Nitrospirota bacterium]
MDQPLNLLPDQNIGPPVAGGTVPVACRDASSDGCRLLARFRSDGLHSRTGADGLPRWRVSPEPYWLAPAEVEFLERLGVSLLAFYRSLNRLYYASVKTPKLAWVHRYLDQGKPQAVIDYGLMRRVRDQTPGILRPDLFATASGFVASELDAVPGGFGLTAAFHDAYGEQGFSLVGGRSGMVQGFARMVATESSVSRVAIVVSDESADYRPEMAWMARALTASGTPTVAVTPHEVTFTEDGLTIGMPDGPCRMDVLYRFFELFDLKNIPKSDLFLYAAKKGTVRMTTPAKAFLEEKAAMALWHHPALEAWWRDDLGRDTIERLSGLFPRTWILDPSEVPPHAVIAGFTLGGHPVRDWKDLMGASQRERRLVIKPSGFSERAWGSRGVVVGHDQSGDAWSAAVADALEAFRVTPHVLQEFHTPRRDRVAYYDEASAAVHAMTGRTRLSPYYFVSGDDVVLGGVLATVCALDKKMIHGMTDAVLAPCAVAGTAGATKPRLPGEEPRAGANGDSHY